MEKLIIAVASDHAGVELKTSVKAWLADYAQEVIDLGTNSDESVDYSDYGHAVANAILEGKAMLGVAICGSGIGISIAANRHKGIRAALCDTGLAAQLARKHNDANVLCLAARLIGTATAQDCVTQFFTTAFEGGRHEGRKQKLDQ